MWNGAGAAPVRPRHLTAPASVFAWMGAHVGANGREGVAIPYDPQAFHDPPLGDQINVFSNLHVQRTGASTGGHETVVKGDFLVYISVCRTHYSFLAAW